MYDKINDYMQTEISMIKQTEPDKQIRTAKIRKVVSDCLGE